MTIIRSNAVVIDGMNFFAPEEEAVADRSFWGMVAKSCRQLTSDWDSHFITAVLVLSLLQLAAAFTLSSIIQHNDYFALSTICYLRSNLNGEDDILLASLLSLFAFYFTTFAVGLFSSIQCSRCRTMLQEHNKLLTSAFILPCYEKLCWVLTLLAIVGVVTTGGMVRFSTGRNATLENRQVPCTIALLPSRWIILLIPTLLVQWSVSKQAVNRSISYSGTVSSVFGVIMLATWNSDESIQSLLLLVYELSLFSFFVWAVLSHRVRSSINYFLILAILSSSASTMENLLSLLSDDGRSIASIFFAISVAITSLSTAAVLITLRADTKYWLGVDDKGRSYRHEMGQYNQTAEAGVTTSFSTRTSVYGVHVMIEEHKANMLDPNTLRLTQLVAKGATAIVMTGELRGSGPVAVKMYTSLQVTEDEVYRFSKETALNVQLSHPNIVRFYGLCIVPPTISLVFEFCEHGSLDVALKSQPKWGLSTKLKAWLDAAKSVAYLHSFSPPLLHRDIKTNNFLLGREFQVKLADFGESHLLQPCSDGTMTIVGTVNFMAPEMISGRRTASYGTPADIYGLAITLWEIFFPGQRAWENLSHLEVYNAVLEGQRPPLPCAMPQNCKDLLISAWAEKHSDRPSAEAMVKQIHNMWLLSIHRNKLTRTHRIAV